MKITVTNWERFWLTAIISGGQGTIGQIRLGNKALDVLEMTDEEKAEVGWRVGSQQVGWTQERDWTLEFKDEVWRLVQMYAKKFARWPQDRRTEALYDKVMVEERDEE